MRGPRIAAGMAVTAIMLGGVALAAAPAASAADIQITVDCVTGDATSNSELVAHPGDTVTLVGDTCTRVATNTSFTWLFDAIPAGAPFRWVISAATPVGTYGGPADSDFVLVLQNSGETSCGLYYCGGSFYLRLAVDQPPIPDWVQAYGRGSADDACINQWHPSWNQWANDGTGGYVCTRTIPQYGR